MTDSKIDVAEVASPKGVAAALIVMSRYLAHSAPTFPAYLKASIDHAASSGLSAEDLAFLNLLLASIKNRDEDDAQSHVSQPGAR